MAVSRRILWVAVAVIFIALIALPASAVGYIYKSQSHPTGSYPNYTTISDSGCSARGAAKTDRVQTWWTDDVASGSYHCNEVAARAYHYAGAQSYWTGWDKDWDSAQVQTSGYVTAQHRIRITYAD